MDQFFVPESPECNESCVAMQRNQTKVDILSAWTVK